MKIKCNKCDNMAVWSLLSGDAYYCDDCVPRKCDCQIEYIGEEYDNSPNNNLMNWEWIEKNKSWRYIDEKGRQYPCFEYSYDKQGFENE